MPERIDKDCLEELFNNHSSFVYRTAYFLTKSNVLADDITQETFIRMIKKFHLFDQTKPIEPWIYRITVNITRNMLRKQKIKKLFGFHYNVLAEKNVEQSILQNEMEDHLWKEINLLPNKSREVIVLHYYLELKLEEVADSLNIPIGTCKSRLNYALTKLRNRLSKNELFKVEQKRKGRELDGGKQSYF
ncbi:RNA polymerase sigma factor [Bacillus sp. AFS055030]|uniref:RNA polymerase sigma factor n=1 Tax=Bacillus sp. AFS055030 TaxID=2033507 RepID=UPI000BFD53DF|nr:RNA polymerase sigma factor [Bacillus sp. AFS055030]PGL68901.1 RNA polymerase subunit sigma-70 [Bacillus sp. AFS055030]